MGPWENDLSAAAMLLSQSNRNEIETKKIWESLMPANENSLL